MQGDLGTWGLGELGTGRLGDLGTAFKGMFFRFGIQCPVSSIDPGRRGDSIPETGLAIK
ncbi:MAG: hypothetical protein F6J93_32730 [Oscillatoria sp. SIO1A7]|nr:hypothetical protein [Oscillatoria sp. SIO1A7]